MSIGARIKTLRLKQNMSRTSLARAAGMAYSTVADIENGHMQSSTRLPEIARALGVSAYWLQTGTGHPESEAAPPLAAREQETRYEAEIGHCIKTLAGALAKLPESKKAPARDLLTAISRSPSESVLQQSLERLLSE